MCKFFSGYDPAISSFSLARKMLLYFHQSQSQKVHGRPGKQMPNSRFDTKAREDPDVAFGDRLWTLMDQEPELDVLNMAYGIFGGTETLCIFQDDEDELESASEARAFGEVHSYLVCVYIYIYMFFACKGLGGFSVGFSLVGRCSFAFSCQSSST